ncbi:MAG TPA: hypothetical protein VNM37_26640, partial [Candidatus Dormibacteraeota bacterium]|nr:hypothetical protein [Candidatus Dormibacteraeota bacterium]
MSSHKTAASMTGLRLTLAKRMGPALLLLYWLACFGAPALPVLGVEPWADPRLTVTNGVALWFDASRQTAGRRALDLAPLVSGQPVDYLADGSGHRRHLVQPVPECRPRFRQEPGGSWLRFDGTNDSLSVALLGTAANDVTLFIVAAPRSN